MVFIDCYKLIYSLKHEKLNENPRKIPNCPLQEIENLAEKWNCNQNISPVYSPYPQTQKSSGYFTT